MAAGKKPSRQETQSQPPAVFGVELEFTMEGELDIIDITAEVAGVVRESGLSEGAAAVFVPGATGAVTCLEYEPGVVADFKEAIGRLAPREIAYQHDRHQADGNGHAHVRAGFLGPSMSVPFSRGELILGVWQQIVLINCDNRARSRRLIVQAIGI